MVSRKNLLSFVLLSLCSFVACAKETANAKQSCLYLGREPSLVVKFEHILSSKQPALKPSLLRQLSAEKVVYDSAEPLPQDAFLLFFTPKKKFISKKIAAGCYSPAVIASLIEDMKQHVYVEFVIPNVLKQPSAAAIPKSVQANVAKEWNLLAMPGGVDTETAFATVPGVGNALAAVLETAMVEALEVVAYAAPMSSAMSASPILSMNCEGRPPCLLSAEVNLPKAMGEVDEDALSGLLDDLYVASVNERLEDALKSKHDEKKLVAQADTVGSELTYHQYCSIAMTSSVESPSQIHKERL